MSAFSLYLQKKIRGPERSNGSKGEACALIVPLLTKVGRYKKNLFFPLENMENFKRLCTKFR